MVGLKFLVLWIGALVALPVLGMQKEIQQVLVDHVGKEMKFYKNAQEISSSQWRKIQASNYSVFQNHRYCMRWCPNKGFPNFSHPGLLYPELYHYLIQNNQSVDEHLEMFIPYEQHLASSYESFSARVRLNFRCCHVCLKEFCFKTLLDARKAKVSGGISKSNENVTLLTFGTIDRLDALKFLLKRWDGPAIVLFYLNDYLDGHKDAPAGHISVSESINLFKKFFVDADLKSKDILVISYTAQMKLDQFTFRSQNTLKTESGTGYVPVIPINTFRNVLSDFAITQFVFFNDIDFIPSETLYRTVNNLVTQMKKSPKSAFIVPHFQMRSCTSTSKFKTAYLNDSQRSLPPRNFQEFKQAIGEQRIALFHSALAQFSPYKELSVEFFPPSIGCESTRENHINFENVKLTNNNQWYSIGNESSKLRVGGVALMKSKTNSKQDIAKWEPFLIISRVTGDYNPSMIPRFNEIFFGRSKNKISFVSALRTLKFQFYFLPREFIVHIHHPYSIYRVAKLSGHEGAMWRALYAYLKQLSTRIDSLEAVTYRLKKNVWKKEETIKQNTKESTPSRSSNNMWKISSLQKSLDSIPLGISFNWIIFIPVLLMWLRISNKDWMKCLGRLFR